MKSGCLLQVASILSFLLLIKAQDVSGPDLSCIRWTRAGGRSRVSFLSLDATGARALFLTAWSEDTRLLSCESLSDPLVTESYAKLCEESDTWGQDAKWKLDVGALRAPGGPCTAVSRRREGKSRRKRAWLFPGTLWCGSGSGAGGYDQLGMFEDADKCCRDHDHCLHVIPAFKMKYGVFNSNVFTVSHCVCDHRFRECLMGVNDSISSMVGYSFFNILQVPCFELKLQKRCTEMYWFGMCKVARVAPYAVFKTPFPYNTSDATSKFPDAENSNFTSSNEKLLPKSQRSSKTQVQCVSRDSPGGVTFHNRGKKGKRCERLPKAAPSQSPPASRIFTTTDMMKTDPSDASGSTSSVSSKTRNGRRNKSMRKSETSSTNSPGTVPVTQQLKLHLHPTTAAITSPKNNNKRKKAPKQNHCCGQIQPSSVKIFQPHCKSCHEQETLSHKTKTSMDGFPTKQANLENVHLRKKAETSKRHSLAILSYAVTPATPVTTKSPEKRKQEKQISYQMERPVSDKAQSTHTVRSLRQKNALPHKTDHKNWCESLKLLDECKFKIPPLERKYDLQNWEPKTAYHCDCTDRLALEIERFEHPSFVPGLLVDFVSQRCFTLPKEKKCHHRKSCFGGFAKASGLHQALKKIEENDTTGVQNSNKTRKRGIPVRLYKRCLRLRKEADLMAENR